MINLLLVLGAAFIGRILCEKFNQPIVLGELLMGLLIGNLSLAHITEPIEFLAQLGIVILLFSSGLALDFGELKRLGKSTFIITAIEAPISFLSGYFLGLVTGFSNIESLFIGTIMIATSIGITAEILTEMKMLRTRIGTAIVGSAVFDDVYGILALTIVTTLAVGGTFHISKIFLLIIAVILFFALSLSIVRKIFVKISRIFTFKSENLLLFGFLILLTYGIIAQEIGLELIIGAFLAGIILGQTNYSHDLLENVSIFGESFFIPIFFVATGMNLSISSLFSQEAILFTIFAVILAFVGKIGGCSLGAFISGFNFKESLTVGVSMIPRGEVALVVTSIALKYGLSKSVASTVMVIILTTSILSPLLLTRQIKKLKNKVKK